MTNPVSDDAQRDMEQRALRNVRALVDKIETTDENEGRAVRRQLVVIVAVVLGLFAIGFVAFKLAYKDEPPRTLVLPPANSAK